MEGRTEHAFDDEVNTPEDYSYCKTAIDIEPQIERCVSRSKYDAHHWVDHETDSVRHATNRHD